MFHHARFWLLPLSLSLSLGALFTACGGYDSTGDGSDGSSTGAVCTTGDDCENIPCLCDDGSDLGMPVNTQHCTNGSCDTPSEACPDSCASFGYSWTGYVVED